MDAAIPSLRNDPRWQLEFEIPRAGRPSISKKRPASSSYSSPEMSEKSGDEYAYNDDNDNHIEHAKGREFDIIIEDSASDHEMASNEVEYSASIGNVTGTDCNAAPYPYFQMYGFTRYENNLHAGCSLEITDVLAIAEQGTKRAYFISATMKDNQETTEVSASCYTRTFTKWSEIEERMHDLASEASEQEHGSGKTTRVTKWCLSHSETGKKRYKSFDKAEVMRGFSHPFDAHLRRLAVLLQALKHGEKSMHWNACLALYSISENKSISSRQQRLQYHLAVIQCEPLLRNCDSVNQRGHFISWDEEASTVSIETASNLLSKINL